MNVRNIPEYSTVPVTYTDFIHILIFLFVYEYSYEYAGISLTQALEVVIVSL